MNLKKTIRSESFLIIGGSQGAKFFQTEFKNTLNKLSKKFNLFVYHQTNREILKISKFFIKK